VNVPLDIVRNRNVIYQVVAVQVQVIDHGLIIIQATLKSFQGLGFLEEVHHGIEVKVVSRQSEVFFRVILGIYSNRCCCKG
jgi:predicted membrane protein